MRPAPGGYATYIRQICNNVHEFLRQTYRAAARVMMCSEDARFIVGRGKIVEPFAAVVKAAFGVALILTSRIYILYKYKHSSYLSNVLYTKWRFMIVENIMYLS